MDLADKLIAQNRAEEREKENDFAPHYGIDETGLPVPNPINAAYIIMRIIGNLNIYRLGDKFYVNKKHYPQNKQSLLALCGRPRIVLFEDIDPDDRMKKYEINNTVWNQVKSVAGSEYGLIWDRLHDMVPEFNKRYLRINHMLVWDRETSEILVIPDEYA